MRMIPSFVALAAVTVAFVSSAGSEEAVAVAVLTVEAWLQRSALCLPLQLPQLGLPAEHSAARCPTPKHQ